jgi:hypothetical protein
MLALLASPLAAQSASPDSQPQNQGPMTIERVHNDFTIGPDARVTRIDGSTGLLAGGYGGWLLDGNILVGGAGYGLTNGKNGTEMGYGGAVLGWSMHTDRAIAFGARALVGGGRAKIAETLTAYPVDFDGRRHNDILQRISPTNLRVIFRQNFVVAEPQGDVILRVARHVRVDIGAGYRLIGGADGINDRLRGATGSVSVQIGGPSGDRQ